MGPQCLPKRRLKHCSRREKQTTIFANGALRVKQIDSLTLLQFQSYSLGHPLQEIL